MQDLKPEIKGHLDILIAENEDEIDGSVEKWQDVLIHGDPDGLRSFAQILIAMADLDQAQLTDLPNGARAHVHLQPNINISASSAQVIVGRIDAKGTGLFYERYQARE